MQASALRSTIVMPGPGAAATTAPPTVLTDRPQLDTSLCKGSPSAGQDLTRQERRALRRKALISTFGELLAEDNGITKTQLLDGFAFFVTSTCRSAPRATAGSSVASIRATLMRCSLGAMSSSCGWGPQDGRSLRRGATRDARLGEAQEQTPARSRGQVSSGPSPLLPRCRQSRGSRTKGPRRAATGQAVSDLVGGRSKCCEQCCPTFLTHTWSAAPARADVTGGSLACMHNDSIRRVIDSGAPPPLPCMRWLHSAEHRRGRCRLAVDRPSLEDGVGAPPSIWGRGQPSTGPGDF